MYKTLDGNDVVRLPDYLTLGVADFVENKPDKAFYWDPKQEFITGDGNDTIQTGLLSDNVQLGDSNDIVYTSPGSDHIRGGSGKGICSTRFAEHDF